MVKPFKVKKISSRKLWYNTLVACYLTALSFTNCLFFSPSLFKVFFSQKVKNIVPETVIYFLFAIILQTTFWKSLFSYFESWILILCSISAISAFLMSLESEVKYKTNKTAPLLENNLFMKVSKRPAFSDKEQI